MLFFIVLTSTCPSGYTIFDTLGCVKVVREEVTWCQAREHCFKEGADLVSLTKNIEDSTPIREFLQLCKYFTQAQENFCILMILVL